MTQNEKEEKKGVVRRLRFFCEIAVGIVGIGFGVGGWEGVVDGGDFEIVVVVDGELVVEGDVLDDAGFVTGEVFVDAGVGAGPV